MKNLLFLYFFLVFNLNLKPSFLKKIGNLFKSDFTNEEDNILSNFYKKQDGEHEGNSYYYEMNDFQKNEINKQVYDLKNKNKKSYEKVIKYIKNYNLSDYSSIIIGVNKLENEDNQKKLQEDLIQKKKELEELRKKEEENRLNNLKNKLNKNEELEKKSKESEKPKVTINNNKKLPKKKPGKKEIDKKEIETVDYFDKIVKENQKEEKEEKQKEFALALSKTIGNDVEKIYSETGKDNFDKEKLLKTILESPKIKEKYDKMPLEKKEQFKKSLLNVIEKKKQDLDNGKWTNYNLHQKYKNNEKNGFKKDSFDYFSLLKTFDKELISEYKKEENFEKNQKLEPQLSKKEIEFIEEEIKKGFLIERKPSINKKIIKQNRIFKKNKKLFDKIIKKRTSVKKNI